VRLGFTVTQEPTSESLPRRAGIDEERPNPGRVDGGVEPVVQRRLGLIAAEERLAGTPPAAGHDRSALLHDVIGAVGNELGVDAENVPDQPFGFGLGVPAARKRPGGSGDERVQRVPVFRQGRTNRAAGMRFRGAYRRSRSSAFPR
jgi:hypothetical protein